jgi:hypothetical protein
MALMVSKTEQVTNLNDASFLKDRIKRSYLQWYQLKLKKLRDMTTLFCFLINWKKQTKCYVKLAFLNNGQMKSTTVNSTSKKLAIQCLNEALCFVSNSVLA